jgi:hypothetical protein
MNLYAVYGMKEVVKSEMPLIDILEKAHIRRCLVTQDNISFAN